MLWNMKETTWPCSFHILISLIWSTSISLTNTQVDKNPKEQIKMKIAGQINVKKGVGVDRERRMAVKAYTVNPIWNPCNVEPYNLETF